MTNKEAYALIGERAEQLSKMPDIQKKMIRLARENGKEAAEKWLYLAAVAALAG